MTMIYLDFWRPKGRIAEQGYVKTVQSKTIHIIQNIHTIQKTETQKHQPNKSNSGWHETFCHFEYKKFFLECWFCNW